MNREAYMMRIGGLASGINTDEIVEKLMAAERMPLNRMEQDRTLLEWKRDGFREINKTLLELDNMMLDMKLSKTYNSKTVTSSMEGAVTATATTSAANGTYQINVEELATSAMNVSVLEENERIDITQKLSDIDGYDIPEEISFKTYNGGTSEEPDFTEHIIQIDENDTIGDVLNKINEEQNDVRAFYDEPSGQVVLETTRTGQYNPDPNGHEIDFGNDGFFTNVLKMTHEETGGTDAKFTYNNGLTLTSKDNSYTLNGMTLSFHSRGTSTLTVNSDIEASFDAIMAFVDKYNEVVDVMNGALREERHRDFPPLTEAQKSEMTEKEIELWEEKAKSGMLRGETSISSGLFAMRNSWYQSVDSDSQYNSITQIGIRTSASYMDGGKLIVDEEKLREALTEDPESVQKLFSNSEEGPTRGIVNRLEDSLKTTMNQIRDRAGNSTSPALDNYTLGRRMKGLDDQISAFEDRLVQIETRYWSQFSAMEKAVQRANQQSAYLMSQFGGNM